MLGPLPGVSRDGHQASPIRLPAGAGEDREAAFRQGDLELSFLYGLRGTLSPGRRAAAVVEAVRDTVVRMQGANGIRAEDIPPIVDELIPQQLLVSAYRKYNK